VERPVYRFCKWLSWLSIIAAAVIMLVTSVDVLMRRLLDMPIRGSFEICEQLLVVVVFCSVAYVMTVNGHVIVDVFTNRYPQKTQRPLAVIALLLSLIVVAMICWGSMLLGLEQYRVGEASVLLHLPEAAFVFVVAFGSALFFLVIIIQFIRIFARVKED
jgi:TRAP-type C4-dicarboxylate transport system permease small subunit